MVEQSIGRVGQQGLSEGDAYCLLLDDFCFESVENAKGSDYGLRLHILYACENHDTLRTIP